MSENTAQFVQAIGKHATKFDLSLSESTISCLARYFDIVEQWNTRLHLIAPCPPEEFAVRHVLESLLAIKHIPANTHVADIGSGGGLPIIPCMIARPDISATLFESSPKKSIFLREASRMSGITERVTVVASRFEDGAPTPGTSVVTCRAVERFISLLSTIVDWSPANSRLILFGGPSLQDKIQKLKLEFVEKRIPESNQRFIFVIDKRGIGDKV